MSTKIIFKCKKCNNDKVQSTFWAEMNTNIVIDGCNSQGEDIQDNWCPNCDEHCEIITE